MQAAGEQPNRLKQRKRKYLYFASFLLLSLFVATVFFTHNISASEIKLKGPRIAVARNGNYLIQASGKKTKPITIKICSEIKKKKTCKTVASSSKTKKITFKIPSTFPVGKATIEVFEGKKGEEKIVAKRSVSVTKETRRASSENSNGGGGGGGSSSSDTSTPQPTPVAFSFVSWGDTKSGTAALAQLSARVKQEVNPVFSLFTGDLVPSGFTEIAGNTWKDALNGGTNNGMFDITFPVRGNHDSGTASVWQNFFDLPGNAIRIGGTNFNSMTGADELTYSFDYRNSHYIGVDILGNADKITASQLAWVDSDLTAAESRGVTHAFLFFHGPIYPIDTAHGGTISAGIIDLINNHPILTASFHGHVHVYAHTTLDNSRIPSLTRTFHQFVTGNAGAETNTCSADKVDYCQSYAGFAVVAISDNNVNVKYYKNGVAEAQQEFSFSK